MLQLLSFVAENERVNIRQRQREGIEAAKARGVRFGRKNNLVLGDKYIWWLRTFSSRVMPVEEVLWVYPRSRRLEGGKKDWHRRHFDLSGK